MYSSVVVRSMLAFGWTATRFATAETIVIEAGNLYFQPQVLEAKVGDILEFHFLPNNHSVVMGDLLDPCQPVTLGGFYSGFLPVSNGENVKVLLFFFLCFPLFVCQKSWKNGNTFAQVVFS